MGHPANIGSTGCGERKFNHGKPSGAGNDRVVYNSGIRYPVRGSSGPQRNRSSEPCRRQFRAAHVHAHCYKTGSRRRPVGPAPAPKRVAAWKGAEPFAFALSCTISAVSRRPRTSARRGFRPPSQRSPGCAKGLLRTQWRKSPSDAAVVAANRSSRTGTFRRSCSTWHRTRRFCPISSFSGPPGRSSTGIRPIGRGTPCMRQQLWL